MTTSTLTIEIKWSESEIAKKSSVSTSALFLQREAEALVHSTAPFSFFSPHFSDSAQRLYHTYMIQSFCTVSGITLKSTHTCFLFLNFHLCDDTSASPSHLGCKGWQTQLKQSCPKKKSIPRLFFFFLTTLLNTPHVDGGVVVLFPPKMFSPHQQCFGIWSLGGNVSIRVHTTLPVQIKSPFTGFCGEKFIVQAGWWWVPTGPYSGSLCRIGSLCSERGPSTMSTVDSETLIKR